MNILDGDSLSDYPEKIAVLWIWSNIIQKFHSAIHRPETDDPFQIKIYTILYIQTFRIGNFIPSMCETHSAY